MKLEWLGVNGFRMTHENTVVLIDPYVTRDKQRLCEPGEVERLLPRADMVAVGHSHWDHLADVPALAQKTGCIVCGSLTTINICTALGVCRQQLRLAEPGLRLAGKGWAVTLFPSRHILNGPNNSVLYAGTYDRPPDPPPRTAPDLLEGGTFAILVEIGGFRVLNIGSANLPPDGLPPIRTDVLLLAVGSGNPTYLESVFSSVAPRVILPSHYDALTAPFAAPVARDGRVGDFLDAVRHHAPEAQLLTPNPLEELDIGALLK